MKISLSVDGGHTYPLVLAASTPNDGTESVIVPNVATTQARVKIEAVGNVFFDVSNADFTVTLPGVIGLDSVSISGKGVVDSFDSSLGPYGAGQHERSGQPLQQRRHRPGHRECLRRRALGDGFRHARRRTAW